MRVQSNIFIIVLLLLCALLSDRHNATSVVDHVATNAPCILIGPNSKDSAVGGRVTFTCRAEGCPKPRVMWYKDNQTDAQTEANGRIQLSDSGDRFTLMNIRITDAGMYRCVATNPTGREEVRAYLRIVRKETQLRTKLRALVSGQSPLLNRVVGRAAKEVTHAIYNTARQLNDRSLQRSAADVFTLFRMPNKKTIKIAEYADIYDRALEQLAVKDQAADKRRFVARLSMFTHHPKNIDCSNRKCFNKRFHSINGMCNNLKKPHLGGAVTPLLRLLPPQYENGVNEPIGWNPGKKYGGFPKPGARLVSMMVLSAPHVTRSHKYSDMVMQWGQFLDHDTDLTPVGASNRRYSDRIKCNETCINKMPCFPIRLPPQDPRSSYRQCMGFTRSSAVCVRYAKPLPATPYYREQINQITAFIDASNIYGSSKELMDRLRDPNYRDGKLRVGILTASKKPLLPFNKKSPGGCQVKVQVPCFLAGDGRANEHLGLLAMHTIWMREHNRLAVCLRALNPHWSGDRVFFEARKIVTAMNQRISYSGYLPKVLGRQTMQQMGRYKGYNEDVNPSISNVFATAAFRFGHTQINPIVYRYNRNFEEIKAGHLPLHKASFAPHKLVQDGGIDPVLRGLFVTGMKNASPRNPMNTELTEKLFKLTKELALDLGALNTQRGRDHGLPGYTAWRRFCKLSVPTDFEGFRWDMPDPVVRGRLRQVYGHPDNVDIFVGGVLEEPMRGALVGPTFACLLADQFKRLRDGDRFWYERKGHFTPNQIVQLRHACLSRVICDNSDGITRVPIDAFLRPAGLNDLVDCKRIPRINLAPWKESKSSGAENRQTPISHRQSFKDELRALRDTLTHLEKENVGSGEINATAEINTTYEIWKKFLTRILNQ